MRSESASWSTAVLPTPIGPVTNNTGTTVEAFHTTSAVDPRVGNVAQTAASGTPSSHAQPVAVDVFEIALPAGKAALIDRKSKLLRYRVDVVDVQMDQGVWAGVVFVF